MTPDDATLRSARETLETVVQTAEDEAVRDRARETAASFAEFETAERRPDHAVFDDHLNTLRQAREHADGEAADALDRALEHAERYREGLRQA